MGVRKGKMMRILMFGMSSYPGGIENYIANYFLSEAFSRGVTIDFVTHEGELAYSDKIREYGHTVRVVPHFKRAPLSYMRAIDTLLQENEYDCVYLNMLSAANILPIRCAVRRGVGKIVAHAHANSTVKGFLRKFLHKVNKRYCKKHATHKFACSKAAGEWLFDSEPCTVIPNAIDLSRFAFCDESRREIRERHGIADGAFVMGHVGRFAEEKNHGFLIDVFKACADRAPNAVLLLVGDGGHRAAIEERVRSFGLGERVVFAGTSAETEKYYSALDCFVFPSTFEGFGMAALEAQAAGLPCFCSDCLSGELRVTDSLLFLPLEAGADAWADSILAEKTNHERSVADFPATFDIAEQRKKLLEMLR